MDRHPKIQTDAGCKCRRTCAEIGDAERQRLHSPSNFVVALRLHLQLFFAFGVGPGFSLDISSRHGMGL
jgi:hypothetical protein